MLWPNIERIIAGAGRDHNLRTISSLNTKLCVAVFWNKNNYVSSVVADGYLRHNHLTNIQL
jgi:hypothetical protein